jgi:hypothetical protein
MKREGEHGSCLHPLPFILLSSCSHPARSPQEKSEARWRDYAADHYFHYYYRYGKNEKGQSLEDAHRSDDLLELAAVSCVGCSNAARFVCPVC